MADQEKPSLRSALSELSLAAAFVLADVSRMVANYDPSTSQAKASEERLRKALEIAREALGRG